MLTVPAGWWRCRQVCTSLRSPLRVRLLAPRNECWLIRVPAGLKDNYEGQQSPARPILVFSECELAPLFLAFSFSVPFVSLLHPCKISNSLPFCPQTELPLTSVGILSEPFLLPKGWWANRMCTSFKEGCPSGSLCFITYILETTPSLKVLNQAGAFMAVGQGDMLEQAGLLHTSVSELTW